MLEIQQLTVLSFQFQLYWHSFQHPGVLIIAIYLNLMPTAVQFTQNFYIVGDCQKDYFQTKAGTPYWIVDAFCPQFLNESPNFKKAYDDRTLPLFLIEVFIQIGPSSRDQQPMRSLQQKFNRSLVSIICQRHTTRTCSLQPSSIRDRRVGKYLIFINGNLLGRLTEHQYNRLWGDNMLRIIYLYRFQQLECSFGLDAVDYFIGILVVQVVEVAVVEVRLGDQFLHECGQFLVLLGHMIMCVGVGILVCQLQPINKYNQHQYMYIQYIRLQIFPCTNSYQGKISLQKDNDNLQLYVVQKLFIFFFIQFIYIRNQYQYKSMLFEQKIQILHTHKINQLVIQKNFYKISPMRAVLLLLILAVLARGFQLQIDESPSTDMVEAKIPSFIGLGYHLLYGNPFGNSVDEGFRAPVFNFTFSQGQTTEDGKYSIPDFTHSTQTTSCSVQSKITQFSGTKNYQQEIRSKTSIDTRLDINFINAAFSFSKTFEKFINSTQTYNYTSSQSNAECTVYVLEMPIYSNQIGLNLDFISGVKKSLQLKDWKEFINHFGTHFASSVTFGGRYFMQHMYSEQSMSLFQSMKIDINIAAKIQYLTKIGVQLSQELKRYVNQTNIVNSKVQTQRQSTIGGQPPKSGNWIDWANTVKGNLAPVKYRLVTLSVLFNFIQGLDAAAAIKSFQDYLNTFCSKNPCPKLTDQRPPPKPLAISFLKSSQISGPLKNQHTYDTNDGKITVAMRVYKVLMGSQGSIDSIQFFLSNGISEHSTPIIGNRAFNYQYTVPNGDEIKCVRFGISYNTFDNRYWKFASMQFVTRKGVQSQVYKGTYTINQYQVLCIGDDKEHFVGFYGRYGNTFDSVGLNIMKQTLQH